jgi:hypothetical protein
MRLICFFCGKSVSTEVSKDTILRAVCVCPECVPRVIREDATTILTPNDDDGGAPPYA